MSDELYKGFRPDEMEYQYNPRESVPEYPELAKVRAAQAKKVRETAKSWLNVSYGSSPRETAGHLRRRQARRAGAGLHSRRLLAQRQQGRQLQLRADLHQARRDCCAGRIRSLPAGHRHRHRPADPRRIAWVGKNIMRYSGDPSRIYVSGHSAGGHLTAMALAHDWTKEGLPQDCIKGAVATSGVFDLDMVMKISVQEQVQLTPEVAKLNSPFLNPPKVKCPLVVAVGSAEPKGWQQMSEDYFNYCKQQGMKVEYLVVPGANHYTMSEKLLDEANPLTQAMIKQMKI